MPNFDKYADYCKTLYIRFKCSRCGFEEFELLRACIERTGDNGGCLRQFHLPKGWYDDEYRGIALCPSCKEAFNKFLRMEEGAESG